jgi:phosphopantetheinyl transferase
MKVIFFKLPEEFSNEYNYLNEQDIYNLDKYEGKTKTKKYFGILLQKYIIKLNYDIPIDHIKIEKEFNGKPYFKNLDYNLSYSKNYVIIAYSDQELGIDIEDVKDGIEKIVEKYGDKYLINKNNNVKNTIIWTNIESYLKLIGTGLSKIDDIKINKYNEICDESLKKKLFNYDISYFLPKNVVGTITVFKKIDSIKFEEINLKKLIYTLNTDILKDVV